MSKLLRGMLVSFERALALAIMLDDYIAMTLAKQSAHHKRGESDEPDEEVDPMKEYSTTSEVWATLFASMHASFGNLCLADFSFPGHSSRSSSAAALSR